MKLPNISQISAEQEAVYLDAPLDRHILVTGPPGTGKTVIAFLRARTLSKILSGSAQKPIVIMYNVVLRRYTENASEGNFLVKTMHSWVAGWWNSIGVSASKHAQRINLKVPYSEKDTVKNLGARWNPKQKLWWVSSDKYKTDTEAFDKWNPTSDIPKIGDDEFKYDWDAMTKMILSDMDRGCFSPEDIHWGHLIIDEGQDFSPDMYRFFHSLSHICFQDSESPPAITVFADENQRLDETHNSTIADIKTELEIADDCLFGLRRNYRNTEPIARLAAHFYVGLTTGIPEPPKSKGPRPTLFRGREMNSLVDFICRYARNNDNEEIGVIVENNKVRTKFYNKIKYRLQNEGSILVQTWKSGDDDRDLEFDRPGTVTVVNCASCKGLEFDAVFVPELQQWTVAPGGLDLFRMRLYVMISRARKYVSLMYTSSSGDAPEFLELLPEIDNRILEGIND